MGLWVFHLLSVGGVAMFEVRHSGGYHGVRAIGFDLVVEFSVFGLDASRPFCGLRFLLMVVLSSWL